MNTDIFLPFNQLAYNSKVIVSATNTLIALSLLHTTKLRSGPQADRESNIK